MLPCPLPLLLPNSYEVVSHALCSCARFHCLCHAQLRGSADLWGKSNREVMGPMYLPEANWLPASSLSPRAASSPFSSPATGPLAGTGSASSSLSQREATWRQNPSPGVLQMAFSADLRLLALALLDGRVVLCSTSEMGLRPVDDIVPEKWVGVVDAACLALGRKQQLLLVGSRRGTVELFDLTKSSMHLRAVSLFDWGYAVPPSPLCQLPLRLRGTYPSSHPTLAYPLRLGLSY